MKHTKIEMIVLYLLLLLFSIIFLFPFVMMVFGSFKESSVFIPTPTFWLPKQPTLINYKNAISNSLILRWLINSIVISVIPVISTVFISALLGYIFAKKNFYAKDTIFWVFMAVLMVPSELTLIPRYIMYDRFNWIDTYWAFIIPGMWSVMFMFLMRQFITTIPDSLIDAANIDGCGSWLTFFNVIFPLCQPALATVATFTFMQKWNDFMGPLIFTTNNSMYNMVVGLSTMIQKTGAFGSQMAAGVLNLMPIFFVFIFFQRYFIDGIVLTGIKG